MFKNLIIKKALKFCRKPRRMWKEYRLHPSVNTLLVELSVDGIEDSIKSCI